MIKLFPLSFILSLLFDDDVAAPIVSVVMATPRLGWQLGNYDAARRRRLILGLARGRGHLATAVRRDS
jgi:hypothetical protein